jgi:preprotein translocase subunit SecB
MIVRDARNSLDALETVSEPNASKTRVAAELRGEYIKNLSFENPRAAKFMEFGESPELEVDVNVGTVEISTDFYEVTLSLEVHAKNETGVLYHLELSYAGLFRLHNIPEEIRQEVLIGDCPKLLFPSLRRVVSDITYSGGFPPLMLDLGKLPGLAQRRS